MSITNPREAFFQALNASKNNQLELCENLCRELLGLNGREVNTLRLLGQVEHGKGCLDEAEKLFRQVIDIAPDYPHAHADLGKICFETGRHKEAALELREALRLDPTLIAPSNLLEEVVEELGDSEAHQYLAQKNLNREALKQELIRARQLNMEGKGQEAEKICLQILDNDSAHIGAKEFLIDRAISTNRSSWAEQLALSLVQRVPESAKWWLKLAHSLSRQDKLEEAKEAVTKSLEIEPKKHEARIMLGGIYTKGNRFDEALEQYNLVLAEHPDHLDALSHKATVLKTLGKPEESISAYQRCLEIDPHFGEAAWSLSNLKTYRFSDSEVESMHRMLEQKDLREDDVVHFNYALGKAFEHREDWDRAFYCYQSANEVKKTLSKWSADRFSQMVYRSIENFSFDFVEMHRLDGNLDTAPIFILGLPRSGSTLQEQILSSHSKVEGTRELPYIPWLASGLHKSQQTMAESRYPEGVLDLSAENLCQIGDKYLEKAERHREQDLPYFIDKLPNNFIYVGLILLAMPNAKIINTKRHPVDNCFGCYKQLWAEGQDFTYDLTDLGRYYRDYHRLMDHWHKVFPGKIYDVQYESVVDSLEENVVSLLEYCGLPFEEGCVHYYRTRRAVNTASSEQVRQPIYKSAVAYWKYFEQHLGPLKEALGDLAVD